MTCEPLFLRGKINEIQYFHLLVLRYSNPVVILRGMQKIRLEISRQVVHPLMLLVQCLL